MNEDQLIEAAEREMDLYRDEIARLQAEVDRERTARLHLAGERDVARSTLRQMREFAWTLSDKLGHREQLNVIFKRAGLEDQN